MISPMNPTPLTGVYNQNSTSLNLSANLTSTQSVLSSLLGGTNNNLLQNLIASLFQSLGNNNGSNDGSSTPPNGSGQPNPNPNPNPSPKPDPAPNPNPQPAPDPINASIRGSSVINEGGWNSQASAFGTGSLWGGSQGGTITPNASAGQDKYSIQLDKPVEEDTVFTVKVSDGTANNARGIPTTDDLSYQSSESMRWGFLGGDLQVGPESLNSDFTVFDSQGQAVNGDTVQVMVRAGETQSESFSVQAWEELERYASAFGSAREVNENFSMAIVDSSSDAVKTGNGLGVDIQDKQVSTITPVAVDLNGDGEIATTGNSTAQYRADNHIGDTVDFDMDANGQQESIEWLQGGQDGLLVDTREIGADQSIDGRALFGDMGGQFSNGFEKMAILDSNGDQQLTGEELEGLAVWADNGDARLQAGELQALDELGITQLSTQYNDVQNERGEDLMRSSANNGQIVTEDVWFAQQR